MAGHSTNQGEQRALSLRAEDQMSTGAQELEPIRQSGLMAVYKTLEWQWTARNTAQSRGSQQLIGASNTWIGQHSIPGTQQAPAGCYEASGLQYFSSR